MNCIWPWCLWELLLTIWPVDRTSTVGRRANNDCQLWLTLVWSKDNEKTSSHLSVLLKVMSKIVISPSLQPFWPKCAGFFSNVNHLSLNLKFIHSWFIHYSSIFYHLTLAGIGPKLPDGGRLPVNTVDTYRQASQHTPLHFPWTVQLPMTHDLLALRQDRWPAAERWRRSSNNRKDVLLLLFTLS